MQNKISLFPRKFLLFSFLVYFSLQCFFLEAKNYGENYDWRLISGGPIQLFALHIGATTSLEHNNMFGYTVGGSIGWNYISGLYESLKDIDHLFDLGIRLKYNFTHKPLMTHLFGTEIYFHFPASTTNLFRKIPQPLSLILGGGGIVVMPDSKTLHEQVTGGYIEVGVGILKYFIINVNLLYRVNFLPHTSPISTTPMQPIEQSFHMEFTIL